MPDGYHPAFWHMLDVGAVARRLTDRRPVTRSSAWDAALLLLIVLHDIGKISAAFRRQITHNAGPTERHSQLSFVLLEHFDARLADHLGGERRTRRDLYAAVAGHHGAPPELDEGRGRKNRRWRQAIGAEAEHVAGAMIDATMALFPDASLAGLTDGAALSWRLSGLTVQSDWIGSNTAWFGVEPADIPVSAYWVQALQKADVAIQEAGLHFPAPRPDPALLPPKATLRPMQQAVRDVAMAAGPELALIEDATGAGKTEAALGLAARMLGAGKGHGLFFALPTVATSNAMLTRIARLAPMLFDGPLALGLSHGRAQQSGAFSGIRANSGSDPQEPVTCGQWLASDRRRVLLADIGVGTIDQALMAVLPTRFHTLRQWALAQKILIVDEAHSYDPFMEEELCRLLWFQAMLGGSAIVMTATLPQRMRHAFATAFQRGLRQEPQPVLGQAYPLLTVIGEGIVQTAPAAVPATCRRVGIHRIGADAAVDVLCAGAARGAACVWVRNSVDDAIAATGALRAAGVAADLLHARFAVADRLNKETRLQATFGRDGTDRAGRVLVATQVVEASLDLDFDVMVSDLAPIGALIQRAGRLWRHMEIRPAGARPVPGPTLHVVSPDPEAVTNARWLQQSLDGGAWVYALPDQWRTARALFAAGEIVAPTGLRALIEAVHGEDPDPVPQALEQAENDRIGADLSERQMAHNQLLKPTSYLEAGQKVYDEERLATRLGIPQVTLWLARARGARLAPWADTWEQSEVRLSRKRYEALGGVDQTLPEIAALKAHWPEWRRSLIDIAPVAEDGQIVDGLRYDPQLGLVLSPIGQA